MNTPPLNALLQSRLREREEKEEHRFLRSLPEETTDFASNDYLGLARNEELYRLFLDYANEQSPKALGSSGSRLISGDHNGIAEFESSLSTFYGEEGALIFPSGYSANIGLISALGSLGDLLFIYDELVHASMRDGFRLSRAPSHKFRHNDLEHLEKLLEKATKRVVVFVESLYSMDGNIAPLKDLAELVKRYNGSLIVDEAHSSGIYGNGGRGLVEELGIDKDVYARIHTWGKAHGVEGAVIVGDNDLKNFLVNFSRPFIYTTGMSIPNLLAGKASYAFIEKADKERAELSTIIDYYSAKTDDLIKSDYIRCGPIQHLPIRGAEKLRAFEALALKDSIYTVPIFSPTVPEGEERIRITLHSYNTKDEIDTLLELYREFLL